MTTHLSLKRSQRLQQIAREHGIALDADLTPLTRPHNPPTFLVPDDERKADAVLGNLKIEDAALKAKSRRSSLLFQKSAKPGSYTYEELYAAHARVIQENGVAGVLEVLLNRVRNVQGNINLARRGSTGVIKRIRNTENEEERGRLLQMAVEKMRIEFVQLLAPFADPQSLKESLCIALNGRQIEIIETLLRYGANSAAYEPTFVNVAQHGDVELLTILLRAGKRVSEHCITRSLLPAVLSQSLPAVLLLVQAGAVTDHDGASALMHAISLDRIDLATAILVGRCPPSGVSIDRALESISAVPPATLNSRFALTEVLLCANPIGNASNHALFEATSIGNTKMMQLLLANGADIHYNNACAIQDAIRWNRADLVAILLQNQSLKPELASELVAHIPRDIPSSERVTILSKLLVNGASGPHCNGILILAAEQNDLDTAQLLVSNGRGDQTKPTVCSVDYNAGRCLQVAVAQNNLPMVKVLALNGPRPSKFSLAKAFSSIPPRLKGDERFLLVQTLMRAGAEGPEVDAALYAAVTGQHKSIRLVELFIKSGATVTDQTLMAAVTQGSFDILKILLSGTVSAQTCAAAIPVAMKLHSPEARFKTIRALLSPATTTGTEVLEISQAVADVVQNCPEDLPLLNLLCREGKANINFENGTVLAQAVKHGDPRILGIMLHGEGSLPSSATIERALKCAIELPPSNLSRQQKIDALLKRAKPQDGMNDALIKEIRDATSATDLSVIQSLLEAGADVNAIEPPQNASEGPKEGAPVCWAVTGNVPAVLDLVLSKRPNARTLSLAFPIAFTFPDPTRYNLCEKLLQAGAVGEALSSALWKVAKEGPPALPLMKLLLPRADVNFKDGRALWVVVHHAFFEGADLLLTPRAVMPSALTKTRAFLEAMKLKGKKDRYSMVTKLLKAGIPEHAVSEALITAVNFPDLELVKVLLQSGASVDYQGGLAVRNAASCGENEILRLLVDGELSVKPSLSTLTSGFGGAMTMKEKNRDSYFQLIQTLLQAGLQGDAVDAALVHAVQDGDSAFNLSELLFNSEASVEHREGEAINIAVQSASLKTLELLLSKRPSENVLKRAYRSSLGLSKEQRYQVIERILKAGKAIDKHVTKTLTSATMESPSDRKLITLLLSHDAFDDGECIIHAAKGLDLRTLTLLVNSPKASTSLSHAFKEVMKTDILWQSRTGLEIVKLMLKKGASGDAVGEALYQAIEKSETGTLVDPLASEFLEVLLEFGADVNYQHGLALQRAAMQVDILLIEKLLPGATADTKAMAIPYLFTCCDDRATVLKAILAFGRSFPEGDPGVDIMFKHPDTNLEPMLFMALDKFPRDTQILRALLDMGYHANQWQLCEDEEELGMEPWPIVFWTLERPEKRISSAAIEMLIDAGANVNFKSKSGMTPLILAIQNHRQDVVAKLISKGANVSVPDPDNISPLSLASRLGNTAMMELLLEADAELDDGSLHDAARELRCDSMRVLIKFGHHVDYPSDRHEGRSALAELCLKAVNCRPEAAKIDEVIQCLVANDSDYRLRSPSEHDSGKTVLHYALDSSDPVSILPILLKMMWRVINEDCFLYSDRTYTYSLTKYVEKGIFQGPPEQKDDILRLLRNKRAVDRHWANDIETPQPDDYCNPPKYIEEEIMHQKSRQKRKVEQREDVREHLELKRITAHGEVEIMAIKTEAEIQADIKKAQVERQLMVAKAKTKFQLDMDEERARDHVLSSRQQKEIEHMRALGNVQVSTQRTIRQEAFEEDRSKSMMQIEYFEKRVGIENDGLRQRKAIENSAMQDQERILVKQSEREMARIKLQKTLVDKNLSLAGSLQGAGLNPRQIGYITDDVSP